MTEDVQLGNHYLIKDTTIALSIHAVHRNPNVWKNPNDFDPDRWLEERLVKEMPEDTLRFAFIPFSAGSRDCAGKLFGIKESILLASVLLRNYTVSFPENFKLKFEVANTLKPQELELKVTKRSHVQ